jgi:hypothetical protein
LFEIEDLGRPGRQAKNKACVLLRCPVESLEQAGFCKEAAAIVFKSN